MLQLRWVLAPGIVFHEFSHAAMCLLLGVRVFEVKWFGAQAFVKHVHPTPLAGWLITLAPLLVGQVVGFFLLASAFGIPFGFLSLLLVWLGISVLLFSFPSGHDVSNAFRSLKEGYQNFFARSPAHGFAALISLPFVALPLALVLAFLWLLDTIWILRGAWTLYVFSIAVHSPVALL